MSIVSSLTSKVVQGSIQKLYTVFGVSIQHTGRLSYEHSFKLDQPTLFFHARAYPLSRVPLGISWVLRAHLILNCFLFIPIDILQLITSDQSFNNGVYPMMPS
ncbi:hypothetical protein PGT21_015118 [Puccinia graminis f. sp. tritici]|uniref:Uncharacterized protein n=1 Tax=Puccinia graminis f. sp. tritici TaxID=56615 RepID=A0A5B0QFA5_PUCGR|nr:hypothetical protein PGT21_015118 [Puccinia graminis f. sp. tritici]